MAKVNLPKNIENVIDRLNRSGFEAYAVGGSVRDSLMGKIPTDYDITTSAMPPEIKAVFSDFKTLDTGIAHGTVTVFSDGFPVEVTTYRIDGEYKDSRHPESVTFSSSLKDDLARRDFTMNAIAYSPNDGISDFFGGKNDIKDKIIRCVGESDKRFNEDALRILRAIRFSSTLGFSIDEETSDAILKNANLLKNISKERIFSEIKKLLLGENAENVILNYRKVFEVIFPKLSEYDSEKYRLSAKMVSLCEEDIYLKFACLFYFLDSGCAKALLNSLKSDKKTADRVCACLKVCLPEGDLGIADMQKCFYKFGSVAVLDFLKLRRLLSIAKGGGAESEISRLISIANEAKKLPHKITHLDIRGDEINAEGRMIKIILEKLLFLVIDKKVSNKKSELINSAKTLEGDMYETK